MLGLGGVLIVLSDLLRWLTFGSLTKKKQTFDSILNLAMCTSVEATKYFCLKQFVISLLADRIKERSRTETENSG